jgi:hypothetical protein
MAKVICPPISGRVGDKVYVIGRFGQTVRPYVPPRNPRTPAQTRTRQVFGALASQWRGLTPEARLDWCAAAIRDGLRISGFSYFMKLNPARIHIGLPRLDYPPSGRPSFDVSPVTAAAVVVSGGQASIKLQVPNPPGTHTLVEVAAPVSAGVRFVQGYRYVGLLPAPVDGWSNITELVVRRFGEPTRGEVLFIRIRQQTDGWLDAGKVLSALVPRG